MRRREILEKKYAHRIVELDIAINTGMRQGEQYSLVWDNIEIDLRILTVPRSKHGEKRHIPLNGTALAAFVTARRYSKPGRSVFWNRYGERLLTVKQWFEESVKAAKITNFRSHDLRHTFASRLVMGGVDLKTVQQLIGHKTISMMLRYAHLAPEHQLGAVQKLCSPSQTQAAATDIRTGTALADTTIAATTKLQ